MSHTPLDMSQLWHCTVVPIYKQLLMDSSNSVTLEAAVGAIHNVAACYWQPSHDFREAVRREKCLPIIVLLAVDGEPVVCAAITALRNLTVDDRNMELIGKYAMQALVSKLPLQVTRTLPRDQVVQATLTTLLEVIKKNSNYAILTEGDDQPSFMGYTNPAHNPDPASRNLQFEPVGRWYEAHCLRRQHKQTLSNQSLTSSSSADDVDVSKGEEDDVYLLGLDPLEWKKQDHYAVLGLRTLRSDATAVQIKKAYRRQVLRHHPDKRRARGLIVKEGDDDYFSCITKAYEILGNITKRRSFDSVDPQFDNSIPTKEHANNPKRFYDVFRAAFKRNSKWSLKRTVPKLGDDTSSYDNVCAFYAFWYDFDSWREYSYLDEEEKEKGENREERRWIEKQNKAARQKLKKEETARIRQMVDSAYAADPRIQRFKDEEREKKMAQKRAKQDAARAKVEAEEKVKREAEEEERLKKEAEAEETRVQAALLKKKKDEHKKLLKKERKTLRAHAEDFNYFTNGETASQRVNRMGELEKLIENLSLESITRLNESLSSADLNTACAAFTKQLTEYNNEREREKRAMIESLQKRSGDSVASGGSSKKAWTDEEVAFLIKGVNVFPAGTIDRWEVISHFISQHVPESTRTAKEVLAKAKDLQKNDTSLKANASKKAFENFEKEKKTTTVASAPSQRVETVADQQIRETGSNPGTWSAEEQKRLEQALKTYPASVGSERWERIAEVVATRSKRDCVRRYKELAELIKAKKAAQDATRANKS